jgi:hypothetical protein
MNNSKEPMNQLIDDQQTFLLPNEEEQSIEELVEDEIAREKRARKKRRQKYAMTALVMTVINVVLIIFGLLWQYELSLMAIGDAIWLAFAIELAAAWTMFVYNKNIFSPMIHGMKTFGLMIVGKRPKLDYYHYMKKIEDDPIPSYYYIVTFISAGTLLIPALVLLFILL